jgi:hypothetical protein
LRLQAWFAAASRVFFRLCSLRRSTGAAELQGHLPRPRKARETEVPAGARGGIGREAGHVVGVAVMPAGARYAARVDSGMVAIGR